MSKAETKAPDAKAAGPGGRKAERKAVEGTRTRKPAPAVIEYQTETDPPRWGPIDSVPELWTGPEDECVPAHPNGGEAEKWLRKVVGAGNLPMGTGHRYRIARVLKEIVPQTRVVF